MNGSWKVIVLGVLGIALIAAPVVAPPSNELVHDTRVSWNYTVEEAANNSYAVYQYANLSERAQSLYTSALRNGGRYTVPAGGGATEFQYPTEEQAEQFTSDQNADLSRVSVAIVRPSDSSLPPANERTGSEQIDVMTTWEKELEIGSGAYIPQFVALFLGVCLLAIAGYLRFGHSRSG